MRMWMALAMLPVILFAGTAALGRPLDDDPTQPAAEADAPAPYSRENLQRVFSVNDIDLPPRPRPNVRYGIGYVEFRALGMDWRVIYLPFAIPLSGTARTTSQQMVDPFLLTGTSIATTPRTFQTRRELNRERKRIVKTEKARLKAQNQ